MDEITVTRKNIKNAYIRVMPDGAVKVSVPSGMSDDDVMRLLENRKDWIAKHREELKDENQAVHLWGEKTDLRVTCGNAVTKGIRYEYSVCKGYIDIRLSRNADEEEMKAVLDGIYRLETQRKLSEFIPEAEKTTGLHAEKWTVKNMKSRWGSCKPSEKKIAISSRLAAYPPECLMHVIIHELCHLRVSGHGSEFYELMDRFCPDWKRERKLLKERY